jgi:hypothetical protein
LLFYQVILAEESAETKIRDFNLELVLIREKNVARL